MVAVFRAGSLVRVALGGRDAICLVLTGSLIANCAESAARLLRTPIEVNLLDLPGNDRGGGAARVSHMLDVFEGDRATLRA